MIYGNVGSYSQIMITSLPQCWVAALVLLSAWACQWALI